VICKNLLLDSLQPCSWWSLRFCVINSYSVRLSVVFLLLPLFSFVWTFSLFLFAVCYDNISTPFLNGTSNECRCGMKKIAIFDQYLDLSRKRYKMGHSYRGTLIGTRMRSVEWCLFQWSWISLKIDFKDMSLLEIETDQNFQGQGARAACLRQLSLFSWFCTEWFDWSQRFARTAPSKLVRSCLARSSVVDLTVFRKQRHKSGGHKIVRQLYIGRANCTFVIFLSASECIESLRQTCCSVTVLPSVVYTRIS